MCLPARLMRLQTATPRPPASEMASMRWALARGNGGGHSLRSLHPGVGLGRLGKGPMQGMQTRV